MKNARSPVLTTGRNAASEKYLKGATRMYNNEHGAQSDQRWATLFKMIFWH